MSILHGELAATHPRFLKGSEAAVIEKAGGPVIHDDNSRSEYLAHDDKAIDQRVGEFLSTTFHSLGTSNLAPMEKKGGLDQNPSVQSVASKWPI